MVSVQLLALLAMIDPEDVKEQLIYATSAETLVDLDAVTSDL